jgi:hypothetical protein
VSAKVETSAAGKSGALVESECNLYEEPAEVIVDSSQWSAVLGEFISGVFIGSTTMPLQAAISLNAPTEIAVWCRTLLDKSSSGELSASSGQLFAVQTSSNS